MLRERSSWKRKMVTSCFTTAPCFRIASLSGDLLHKLFYSKNKHKKKVHLITVNTVKDLVSEHSQCSCTL
jgi:hypothetical protein